MLRTSKFLPFVTGGLAMPAAQNLTAVMMEVAYQHHRIAACHINCQVAPAAFGDAVLETRWNGLGSTAPLPHKFVVIEHLDGLDD